MVELGLVCNLFNAALSVRFDALLFEFGISLPLRGRSGFRSLALTLRGSIIGGRISNIPTVWVRLR
jgi:hypothetical protein